MAEEEPPGDVLRQQQRDKLEKHRRLRQKSAQSADPSKIIWTRTSEGEAITELGEYWAEVVRLGDGFAFFVFSQPSGKWMSCGRFADPRYETEQQAMRDAVKFMRSPEDPAKKAERIIREVRQKVTNSPTSALGVAIFTATGRAAKNLMGLGGIELDQKGDLKEEDWPRYDMLHSEILYFYMHMTLRLAHGQGFTEPEITALQHEVFPLIIEAKGEGPISHWPEEVKAKIKSEHYENVNSAEFEYASCKEIYPTTDPLSLGNSVYAKFARNIERQLGQSHNPEISLQIIMQASEQLCAQPFPKLLRSIRKTLKSRGR
jgi:hypothetical protein